MFINGFSKIFRTKEPRINSANFDSFLPCISNEENRELIKEVTEEEILPALSQINGLKALGFDGLQASFYKKY